MQFDELNGLKRLVLLKSFHEQLRVLSLFCPELVMPGPGTSPGQALVPRIHDLNREA